MHEEGAKGTEKQKGDQGVRGEVSREGLAGKVVFPIVSHEIV